MVSAVNKSILIVDNDPSLLRALGKTLSGAGALVATSQSVADAIEVLSNRRRQIDLVIADLRMPFVTGMTLLHVIRETFPALPVIVLTGFGTPKLKAECLRQGATAFLEKPVATTQLLAAIRRVFAGHPGGPEPAPPG